MGQLLSFPRFEAVLREEWPWPDFTPMEMACKGTGIVTVHTDFMNRLQGIRDVYNGVMNVSSGYRAPEYNRKVSKTGYTGPHTTGRAVDITIFGYDQIRLLRIALAHGMTGIGLKQKGPHHLRFMHLDDLSNDNSQPRPWNWTY